ncbi:MAG TPA: hypothetical protein VNQ76_18250 [Planctomicrobium sp.]|nr:hypothetical protein [Planctomicrobium sp.]
MYCRNFDVRNDQSLSPKSKGASEVEFPITGDDAVCRSSDSFFDHVQLAWNHHFQADFSAADRLFGSLLTPRHFTETGLEWGKSLRFRGDHARALTLLDAALENAKRQNDLESQLNACCQMMLSFRQISDESGRWQSLQQAIRFALGRPHFGEFPAILQLEIDREHGRFPSSDHFPIDTAGRLQVEPDFEACAMLLQTQGELAHQSKQYQRALQCQAAAYENFLSLGHFEGALQSAEHLCASHLAQGNWKTGITAFSEIRKLAKLLGDHTKVADTNRWESKLQRAFCTIGEKLLHN